MTISSLLLLSPPPLSSVKPPIRPPPPSPAKLPALRLRAQLGRPAADGNYKHEWMQELQRSAGSGAPAALQDENLGKDDHDFGFQSSVDRRAVDNVRMLVVDAVQQARAGHPGMALGMAEVGYYLYRHAMRYSSKNPKWWNRDRFVLSAGHGCLLQYVCMHLAGFESVQLDTLTVRAHRNDFCIEMRWNSTLERYISQLMLTHPHRHLWS